MKRLPKKLRDEWKELEKSKPRIWTRQFRHYFQKNRFTQCGWQWKRRREQFNIEVYLGCCLFLVAIIILLSLLWTT